MNAVTVTDIFVSSVWADLLLSAVVAVGLLVALEWWLGR